MHLLGNGKTILLLNIEGLRWTFSRREASNEYYSGKRQRFGVQKCKICTVTFVAGLDDIVIQNAALQERLDGTIIVRNGVTETTYSEGYKYPVIEGFEPRLVRKVMIHGRPKACVHLHKVAFYASN